MAQLRDAQTSQHVFTGTPLEVAAVAKELGPEVIFDGVGQGFDPDATITAAEENAKSLASAAVEAKGDEKARLEQVAADAQADLDVDPDDVAKATGKLEAARKAQEIAS